MWTDGTDRLRWVDPVRNKTNGADDWLVVSTNPSEKYEFVNGKD